MYDAFYILDIDKDGLDDVLATRGNSGEFDGLFWLKQERSIDAQVSFAPAREADSRALALADDLLSRFAHWLLQ